jgi:hypothetical protein
MLTRIMRGLAAFAVMAALQGCYITAGNVAEIGGLDVGTAVTLDPETGRVDPRLSIGTRPIYLR